jgi:plastocyanin
MSSYLRPAVLLVATLTALGGGILAGCGDDNSNPPPGTVTMREYEFEPKDVSIRSGQALSVVNDGEIAHNLTIEREPRGETLAEPLATTGTFLPGNRRRLRVALPPGTYRMICTVPGHDDLGMLGTLHVR